MRGEDPLFRALTFAPEAGLCRFDPQEVDLELGASWLYPRPASKRSQCFRTWRLRVRPRMARRYGRKKISA